MIMEVRELNLGTEVISYALKRTLRKTLAISVAPDGGVHVVAPLDAGDVDIELRLRKRAAWILDTINNTVLRAPPLPDRRYVPGETHLYLGRQYRLRIEPETLGTRREDDRIIVGGVPVDASSRVRNRLYRWYESEGLRVFAERLTICLRPFGSDFRRPRLKVAAMERRWGSYVKETHSLVLNHSLMQVAVPLIDYVITHELCHVRIQNHGPDYQNLLNRVMPDHIQRKAKLEQSMT